MERGRCFSPTSATDVRHEHPCHRPTAERAGFTLGERCVDPADPSPPTEAGAKDPRCVRPPCGDPTPADPRLTARCQLRPFPCTLTVAHGSLLSEKTASEPSGGPRRRTVVGCGAAARATSDVSCHAHSRTTVGAIIRPRTPRTAAAAASSKATACDDPRRLPSAGVPWTRACARGHPRYWREPVTVLLALPRGSRLPGPVRQPLLSRRMTRQRSWSARSSRVGERCRAPPVDFCNRNDPRARPRTSELRSTTPAVARWCSFSPGGRALSGTFRAADGLSRLRELASRASTGQGLLVAGDAGSVATSPTAIARGRSFAPTRSTRTPHVASRDERRPETTVSPEARCARLPRLTSHADACAPSCVPGPAAAGAPG